MIETTAAPRYAGPLGALRRRWATLVGIGFAALVAADLTRGVDLAPVLAASAAIYLGAAALRRHAAAWPLFFATVVVIVLVRVLDDRADATWAVLGFGALLAVYGLLRGAARPTHGLPLQGLALLGFGAAAAVAPSVAPDVGGYLVAVGLLGHAVWDLHHHRTRRVVSRSFAEFCLVLDTLLVVAIVLVTALT